jgi:VanZ family protein
MNRINVSVSRNQILRALPAGLVMLAIFLYSAGQALDLPQSLLRLTINKGGHMIGYAVLAWSYWRFFEFHENKRGLAWSLAVLYAITDEFHQSFVPGRHPSLVDVLVFDNLGAFISIWLSSLLLKQKQPAAGTLVVEEKLFTANR